MPVAYILTAAQVMQAEYWVDSMSNVFCMS